MKTERNWSDFMSEEKKEFRPTKKHIAVLERLMAAEIYDRLPAQLKDSKPLLELEQAGYCHKMERKLGGIFPVTIKGWQLTLLGHLCYCQFAASTTPD
jgi:hypothetical protein